MYEKFNMSHFWAYRIVYTQTNAGGGNVIADISNTSSFVAKIHQLMLGPDDYGAARTCSIKLIDQESTPNTLGTFVTGSIDNTLLRWPYNDATEGVTLVKAGEVFLIPTVNKMSFEGLSLAQNETLTVTFILEILGKIASGFSVARSTGTVGAGSVVTNKHLGLWKR